MTKTEFKRKYAEVVKGLTKDLTRHGETALVSGAIDLSAYENNFVLPKIVAAAALHKMADGFYVPSPRARREISNLKHFI